VKRTRTQTFVLSLILLSLTGGSFAQSTPAPSEAEAQAVLSKLAPPAYPPLARQARISGDVDVKLVIRRDGRVESAVVVSGHPMLTQAALNSAEQSQFECHNCVEAAMSYTLKYRFQIIDRGPPKDCEHTPTETQPPAEMDASRHQVAVSAWEIWTCDPVATSRQLRFRSPKCLYLWRCGHQDVK
jgi:TonB family protein